MFKQRHAKEQRKQNMQSRILKTKKQKKAARDATRDANLELLWRDADSVSDDDEEILDGAKTRAKRSGTYLGGDIPPAVCGTLTDPARGMSPITTMDMSSVAAHSLESNYSLVETNDQI